MASRAQRMSHAAHSFWNLFPLPFPTFMYASLKWQVLKSDSHDRSWITEVNTNLSPCFRRKSWRMKTRNPTQQKMVDKIMVACTAWIDWYSAKTKAALIKNSFSLCLLLQWGKGQGYFRKQEFSRGSKPVVHTLPRGFFSASLVLLQPVLKRLSKAFHTTE